MTLSSTEFLGSAAELISDFDGKHENLRFLDSVELINSIKESYENLAVNLIKTKLKGTTRNLIKNESTLGDIITKLTNCVEG